MVDKQKLAEIMYGLAGNFGAELDEYTLKLWHRVFESDGITIEQIKEAAISIIRVRTIAKMPTLAEFLEHIQGSVEAQAQSQADVVYKAIRTIGSAGKPAFEDQVTDYLMTHRWQWRQWSRIVREDEIKWWRKEFVEAYKDLARNPASMNATKQLSGKQSVKQLVEGIG